MKVAKGKKIDVNNIDLEELKEKTVENPGLTSIPHSVGSALVKPVDKGKIKGRAMAAMKEQTEHQLHQLYEQMQTLVNQASAIKKRVEVSNRIYLAQMNFDPIIGKKYYLYQSKNGRDLLSMVSPKEWGKKIPYESYLACVKLLSDHTWDVLEAKNL
jgi:hypothetical protein